MAQQPQEHLHTGTCLRFNNSKGFGFIKRSDGKGNIFVHHSQIESKGRRELTAGEKVEFEIFQRKDGRTEARNVKRVQQLQASSSSLIANNANNTNNKDINDEKKQDYNINQQNIDCFDASRRNSFFIEWRVTDKNICQSMDYLQKELLNVSPKLQILQSCASDNIHITMNELILKDEKELTKAINIVKQFEKNNLVFNSLKKKDNMIDLNGFDHFNNKILFVNINAASGKYKDKDKDNVFVSMFDDLKERFVSGGLKHSNKKFSPHITVCKARKGGKQSEIPNEVWRWLRNDYETEYGSSLGKQQLSQLVFCVKRKKEEKTPPILYTIE